MTLILNGTVGVSDVDGSAATPAIRGTDANTGMFFPAADTIAFAEGGAEVMRIDSAGNVGIGTSSPATYGKLAVAGSILNVPDTSSVIAIGRFSSGYGGAALSTVGGATFMSLQLEGVERARIDTNGNFMVGTTSVSNSALLTVAGTVSASLNGRIYSLGTYNNTTGNAANMHIAADGHFFRSTSSLKYKTDVQTATHGLAEVMGLRPVTYKGTNDGDTVFGGLIAEEVHAVGLTEFVQYAEDGSPDALAYGNMVSLCIKAIQELKAQNDELKARVDALNV